MMTSMAGSETTVLDRQGALFKWQQLQQHETTSAYFNNQLISTYLEDHMSGNHGNGIITNVWPDLAIATYPLVKDVVSDGGVSSESSPSPVKRKTVGACGIKVGAKVENMRAVKKARRDVVVEAEGEIQQTSKGDSEGKNGSGASQKTEKLKVAAPERTDFIHVRARRGQATDSHSLAERVRREKISERMKYLQDLVPGCNKITGKAGMLDEIINYVQSLQKQVEFLSMRLAAAHPRIDLSMDQLFSKEINQAGSANIPRVEVSDPSYLQFNPMGEVVTSCGFDTTMHQSGLPLRRNAALMSASDAAVDPSLNVHGSSLAWENDIQNLYNLEFHQGRGLSLPLQFLQGMMMSNTAKMEL